MEQLAVGRVVLVTHGHQKGMKMCVIGQTESRLELCDGKEHRVDHPKCKNPKHVTLLSAVLSETQMRSNRAIRKALKLISEA